MSITGVFNNLLDKVGLYPPPWALEKLGDCLREPSMVDELRKLLEKYPDAAKWQPLSAEETPLLRALWHRNFPAAKVLAEADSSILGPTWKLDTRTPLRVIVERQNGDSLTALAKLGANINETDSDGNTLLHHLAMNGDNPAFVNLLVALGADPRAKNKKGDTPLMTAARSGRLIEAFFPHDGDLEQRDAQGNTLLMAAAQGKTPENAIKELARLGADPEAKNGLNNDTALEQSVRAGNVKAVIGLLSIGAQLEKNSPLENQARIMGRNNAAAETFFWLLDEPAAKREERRLALKEELAAHRDRIKQEEIASCNEGLDAKIRVKPIRLKR